MHLKTNPGEKCFFEDQPMQQEVKGDMQFPVVLPIKLPENLTESDPKEFDLEFEFRGPKGNSFGQAFNIKVGVSKYVDDEYTLYKTAIQLVDAQLGTLPECLEALKLCNGDEGAATTMLVDKKAKADGKPASEVTQGNN